MTERLYKVKYFVETRNKNGIQKYSKPYPTKENAERDLWKYESKKQWARLVEYCGLFPVIIDHTSLAMLELTTSIRDNYKGDPKHQKAIAACNKHIAELEVKIKS